MEKNYTKEQILNALLDTQPYRNKELRRSMSDESFEIARFCMEICMTTDSEDLGIKRKEYMAIVESLKNKTVKP